MRKKYLSALLFGALLFASAGTFTSCKDYDDDINNLQSQITANADAIKALQDLVNAGKYVSGVAMEGQTITFTFSDGSTQPITIPAGEKGQTVVVKDGELYIDDEPTGIKVAEELDTEAGLVKSENGTWWVLNENGEYTNTNIPVSGITVSGSEKDGYTFTIYNEKGEAQTVKLPTAASSITNIAIGINNVKVEDGVNDAYKFEIAAEKFNFTPGVLKAASDWKGTKKFPNNGDYVLSSPSKIAVRIDPVNVDATTIDFYLTNTKNWDLKSVVLYAQAESGDNPLKPSEVGSRAANTGNGLYDIKMKNIVVPAADFKDTDSNKKDDDMEYAENQQWAYALNAGHACRSKYDIRILTVDAETLSSVYAKQGNTTTGDATIGTSYVENTTNDFDSQLFKVGSPITIESKENSALYDMYLEADQADIDTYGLTFDQANHTVTISKNPDVSSLEASFTLKVWTVANNGTVKVTTMRLYLNPALNTNAEYQLITHDVSVAAEKNFFGIDLSTMKNALGDDLNAWLQNVKLPANGAITATLYKEDKQTVVTNGTNGFTSTIVEEVKANATGTADRNKAKYIKVDINNTAVNNLKLGTTYYLKYSFTNDKNQELNSIFVPVKFTAPALSAQFVKESAVFKDGGNTAYAYMNVADQESTLERAYKLSRAFSAMPDTGEGVTLSLDNVTKVVENTNYTSASVAKFSTANNGASCTKEVKVQLNDPNGYTPDEKTHLSAGYGKELTIKAVANAIPNVGYQYKNTGWIYASAEDATYTFKIKVMSPIYEGTVTATDNIVTIPATGSEYHMSNNDIKGTTYNNITYKVLPDKVGSTADWTREEIAEVTADSNNKRVFTIGNNGDVKPATNKYQDGEVVGINEGYFIVVPENIAETTESTMTVTVTDVWGYSKLNDIKVKITVGE